MGIDESDLGGFDGSGINPMDLFSQFFGGKSSFGGFGGD